MRQLLHLKEVIKLRNGLKFSLKVLFETFLIGILFSVLSELVFLAFAKFLNIDIYLNTEVIMSILTASFLTFIFSRKNIFNQLFIGNKSLLNSSCSFLFRLHLSNFYAILLKLHLSIL